MRAQDFGLELKQMASKEDVHANFTFRSPSVPELGLVSDTSYPYRVYVLQCRHECMYVGIAHRSEVKRRISGHFDGSAHCHYTEKNPPTGVLLVWPAMSTAVESFVFHALLGRMPAQSLCKLGGWLQTSSRPSPLAAMVHEVSYDEPKHIAYSKRWKEAGIVDFSHRLAKLNCLPL